MSLPSIVSTSQAEGTGFYRFPVAASESSGRMIWSRRKATAVIVSEVAINGFSVVVSAEWEDLLTARNLTLLEFQGASFEVIPEQVTHLGDGRLLVRLATERDVTQPTRIRSSRWLSKRLLNQFESIMALPLFATLLIASLMMLALPGFGESLGTASLFESILDWVQQSFNQFSESLF
ncbi:MAG: hypothetical protein L7U72_02730 [Rubripirellula sp.]|nr:hypothetical protein [Rubripirellula sp.]